MRIVGSVRRAGRRFVSYPPVRRRAAAIAERFPAARSLGNAVLGAPPAGRKKLRTMDIRPGLMFTEVQGRRLPIVVVVCTGTAPGDTERLADTVERAQLTTGTFRPLFVVDSGELAPFRRRSYAVEAVMPEAAYRALNPHDAYSEYLYTRVTDIATAYGTRSVVPLTPDVLDALPPHVLRLLGAIPR